MRGAGAGFYLGLLHVVLAVLPKRAAAFMEGTCCLRETGKAEAAKCGLCVTETGQREQARSSAPGNAWQKKDTSRT